MRKTFIEHLLEQEGVDLVDELTQKANEYSERAQMQGDLEDDPHAAYLKGVSDGFDMAAGHTEKQLGTNTE